MQHSKLIKVLVMSERNIVRAGHRALLESCPDLTVIGEAENTRRAIQIATAELPDVAIIDSPSDAVDMTAIRRIVQKARFTLVLVDSIDQRIRQLPGLGVDGVLLHQSSSEMVCAAVRMIAAGYTLISPAGVRRTENPLATVSDNDYLEHLTRREADVLRLIAQGLTNAEISTELCVSESTVKSHVQHMFSKLELRNRVHAVIFAYEIGVVRAGTPEILACAG